MYFISLNKNSHLIMIRLDSPSFVSAPSDVEGSNGDRIILQCQVDSNPKAEYVWMRSNDISKVGIKIYLKKSNCYILDISGCWHRAATKLHSVISDSRELHMSGSSSRLFTSYEGGNSPNTRTSRNSWEGWGSIWKCW